MVKDEKTGLMDEEKKPRIPKGLLHNNVSLYIV